MNVLVAAVLLTTLVDAAPASGAAKARKATAPAAVSAKPAVQDRSVAVVSAPVGPQLLLAERIDTEASAEPSADDAASQNWLDEAPAAPAEIRRGRVGTALLLLFTAAACVGGTLTWQRRRRQPATVHTAESIHLLATKALGSKQRLALIEVCGERLLLASCDGEVTLLSHLPGAVEGAPSAQTTDAPALQNEAMRPHSDAPAPQVAIKPVPSQSLHAAALLPQGEGAVLSARNFSQVLADKSPQPAPPYMAPPVQAQQTHLQPPPLPAAAAAGEMSSDLAGLRAWRAQSSKGCEVRA